MKHKVFTTVVWLFCSIALSGQYGILSKRIILKLKNDISAASTFHYKQNFTGNNQINIITQKYNAVEITKQPLGKRSKEYIYIIQFPENTNISEVINDYYKTGKIDYVEPDNIGTTGGEPGYFPNDHYYFRQWGLHNDGSFSLSPSTSGADIDMENAWNIEQGDSNIIVAIIDSGVKLDHPEFAERIWKNYNEIPNNGIDDDSNGYIDDIQGWDFVDKDNKPVDDLGHGTNVAGIIGANGNNTIGYAGVDWNCKLMILKGINSSNFGYYSWWTSAIYYAVDNGAKVINMSLGGESFSITLQNAINYALNNNVVVAVSMMNTNSNTTYYPAGFAGIIAVGSTNPDDTRTNPFFWSSTSGSNYGNHISVVAPGNYIYGLYYHSNYNYNTYWGGTSQATPLVSGLASLLLAQDPTRTPSEVKSIIENSAEDQVGSATEDTPGWDKYYGHGRINAFNALSAYTGTESLISNVENFKIFPNPADKDFTVTLPSGTDKILIYNSMGKQISTIIPHGQLSEKLHLPENGIYFIKIIMSNKIITKQLMIVSNAPRKK